tara:strand:- start:113 stop:565 length:453 start_codon:yes stop_codon:yes gene_type:complete
MNSIEWLNFNRKVRFGDCDSANVIHFHNLLKWSHEAWEESIEKYGIPIDQIFPINNIQNRTIYPIINCDAKFFSPIKLGDSLLIQILPSRINAHLFKIKTIFFIAKKKVAEGIIIHCSINEITREKVPLPENLEKWIEASNITNLIQECN